MKEDPGQTVGEFQNVKKQDLTLNLRQLKQPVKEFKPRSGLDARQRG